MCNILGKIIHERNSVEERVQDKLVLQKDFNKDFDMYKTSNNFHKPNNEHKFQNEPEKISKISIVNVKEALQLPEKTVQN
mmetsp:Transcript_29958/g.26524  ORF Transcript_29958/g.26524 Transcript_29958/m.26524 type:complete len:80 (+) Transcript_29958:222-461(+)